MYSFIGIYTFLDCTLDKCSIYKKVQKIASPKIHQIKMCKSLSAYNA